MPRWPSCRTSPCTNCFGSPSPPGPVRKHRTHVRAGALMRIELHAHSTASDGEHPPAEVVRRAAAAGISVLALTDHDTLGGIEEATWAGAELGVKVIAGCEFSVAGPGGEMHLLGYFISSGNSAVE